jgi:hypothetical protein
LKNTLFLSNILYHIERKRLGITIRPIVSGTFGFVMDLAIPKNILMFEISK